MFGLNKKKDSFKFYVPISYESIEKGTDDTSNSKYLIKIKGVASSKTEDTDGETLDPIGFTVKKGALINWNHQASKTSSAICGKLLSSAVINNGQDFFVEGGIYNNTEGKAVAELIDMVKGDPDIVIGWSIEGQVKSRHPLDSKKITGAVISGIALTHMPKNGNTWVDIVKGEYSELDPKEGEEDEDEIEKDMTAEGTQNLTCHDPAATQKKPKNLVGLTKSQVFEKISDRYEIKDFVFINKIYNFVKSIKDETMADEKKITPETLEKALSLLDAISKGETTEDVGETTTTTTTAAPVVVEKSEEFEFAKSLVTEGLAKEACIEGMIRKGYSYTSSLENVDRAIAEKPAADGSETTLNASDIAKSVLLELEKSMKDTIGNSLTPLNEKIVKGFSVVSELMKSQSEENTILKSELSKLTERISTIEKTPIPGKSARNVPAIDRFVKSEDGGASLPAGFREVNINDSIEKSIVMGEIESNFDFAKSDTEKKIWGDAMSKVQLGGLAQLDPNVARHLKIKVVA